MNRRKAPMDYALLAAVVALVCAGLVMIYSASAILAEQTLGDPLYFFKRQLVWAALGFCAMAWASRVDYNRYREWMLPIFAATAAALLAVLFLPPTAGVKRWLRFGPVGVQPAEFAKLTAVMFLAYYLDRRKSKLASPLWGVLAPAGAVAVLLVLIALGRDIGTPALIFAASLLLIFVGGARLAHLLGLMALAAPVAVYELLKYPYRRARLMSFLHPFDEARGAGYQLAQSILAVGSGGWFGKGFGASQLKLLHLPTPHTDFIFPVVCEEMGLVGALGLLSLFALLLVRGTRVARRAPNLYGTLLAAGITFTICLQAFFNVGMSIGVLPTKGIPLPFISFGGSSLLATLLGVGILLNISRQAGRQGAPT